MKKVILMLIVLVSMTSFAQNYESNGDVAYRDGDYAEAELQYNAALSLMESQKNNVNSPEYLAVQKKLVRAQQCASLRVNAESKIAAARRNKTEQGYRLAADTYIKLLEINPTDIHAKGRIKECNDWIAAKDRAERAAKLAAEEKARKAEMVNALKTRKIKDWDAYMASIPKAREEEKAFVAAVRRYLTDGFKEVSADSIEVYNKMGDLFTEAEWEEKARDLYDCSASLADPEGLYKIAMTSKSKRARDYLCLLLSSMSGYKPAVTELEKYKVKITDSTGLYKFHRWLNDYQTDSSAALSLFFAMKQYEKNDFLSHTNLNLTEILKGMSRDHLKAWIESEGAKTPTGQRPWAEYFLYLGMSYADLGESDLALNLMSISSELGFEPADEWMSKDKYWAANPPDVKTYQPLLEDLKKQSEWRNECADEFIKYVKGEVLFNKQRAFYAADNRYIKLPDLVSRNEALLLCIKFYLGDPKCKFEKRILKDFVKENMSQVFDNEIVSHCRELCGQSKSTKFGLKQLEKLQTEQNLYDRSYVEGLKRYLLFQDYDAERSRIISKMVNPPRMTQKAVAYSFSIKPIGPSSTSQSSSSSSSRPGSSSVTRSYTTSRSSSTATTASSRSSSASAKSAPAETVQLSELDGKIAAYYKSKEGTKFSQTCYRSGGGVDQGFPIEYTMKYEGNGMFLFTFTQRYNTYSVRGKIENGKLKDLKLISGRGLASLSVSFRKDKKEEKYWVTGAYEKSGHFPVRF